MTALWLELRLLWTAYLLGWAFEAVPKDNHCTLTWIAINKAAQELAKVRVARDQRRPSSAKQD